MPQIAQIDESSVFLVSGGARGVTAQCVMKLAQAYSCRWILLGRSPQIAEEPAWAQGCEVEAELKQRIMQALKDAGTKPTPTLIQKEFNQLSAQREIRATLNSLRLAGRTVEYLSADVTNAADLQRQLAPVISRLGAITGIIHGAGNLADKLIEKKTEQDFEWVYGAKVQGLENLLSCVPASQLQYLVLFSSVAGFYGNAGQADYALANEILNKSAHLIKQQYPACHVVSVNWGPWDSGMVTPELKRIFADRKIDVIPLEVGAQLLVNELAAEHHDAVQIVVGSFITPTATPSDATLRTYRIHRHLTLEANPFLQGGELPTMIAASWLIRSCEQLYPGYELAQLENFQVIRAIDFNGSQPELFTVDIQELSKQPDLQFGVVIWSAAAGEVEVYYQGQVRLRPSLDRAHPPFQALPSVPSATANVRPYETLIQAGESFQGIEKILEMTGNLSELSDRGRLVVQCRAPQVSARQQGQFGVNTLNPFAAETMFQALQIWSELGGRSLPDNSERSSVSIQGFQTLEHFKLLPFNQPYWLVVEGTEQAQTLTAHDRQGEVYLRLSGVQIAASKRVARVA
jgi:NAD(P)-dependent dehydrogenase (short-subunit alcohol dehydrogenase family)